MRKDPLWGSSVKLKMSAISVQSILVRRAFFVIFKFGAVSPM